MNLDSKSLPLVAGLLVLVVAAVFLIGRNLVGPGAPTPGSAATVAARGRAPELTAAQRDARAAIRRGEMDEAIRLLEQVPATDASHVSVLGDLAVMYERSGRPDAALGAAEGVLAAEPEDAEAHHQRCRALYGLGRLDGAEISCLRALEIVPAHVAARYTIGLVRVAQGRLPAAVEAYLRAMNLNRAQEPMLDALRDLTEMQKARPDFADPHYAMALFASTLGSREQELAELEQFLALGAAGPVADQARRKLDELRAAKGS